MQSKSTFLGWGRKLQKIFALNFESKDIFSPSSRQISVSEVDFAESPRDFNVFQRSLGFPPFYSSWYVTKSFFFLLK